MQLSVFLLTLILVGWDFRTQWLHVSYGYHWKVLQSRDSGNQFSSIQPCVTWWNNSSVLGVWRGKEDTLFEKKKFLFLGLSVSWTNYTESTGEQHKYPVCYWWWWVWTCSNHRLQQFGRRFTGRDWLCGGIRHHIF